jgi:hypothetical protein
MIYIRDEGEPIRQGFNIYPRTSRGSKGFLFLVSKLLFRCRYSVIQKRWLIGLEKHYD